MSTNFTHIADGKTFTVERFENTTSYRVPDGILIYNTTFYRVREGELIYWVYFVREDGRGGFHAYCLCFKWDFQTGKCSHTAAVDAYRRALVDLLAEVKNNVV